MIDIKLLRESSETFKRAVQKKNFKIDVDRLIKLDVERRALQQKVDTLRALKNEASKKIAAAKPSGRQKLIKEMKGFDTEQEKLEKKLANQLEDFETLLLQVPNLPKDDVKTGESSEDSEVIEVVRKPPKFNFPMKDYLSLGESLGVIDIARAGKVSGTRFGYLLGGAAELERALMNYGVELLKEHGFKFIIPPVMIKGRAMEGMGYLAQGGERETYHLKDDDLFLVGTSEQSIGPMFMDETIHWKELPKRFIAFSTCFRREAGSYGKDTKGILRVHQFDKLEMFSFTLAEESDNEHELFLSLQRKFMDGLKLPYRVVKLCAGDLSVPSARTYDIETWIPSERKYRETHSTSTTTDFQSRRLNIRYKIGDEKPQFVHMVNGTLSAMGRMIIAILENYQESDGSIRVPEVLQPYLGASVLT